MTVRVLTLEAIGDDTAQMVPQYRRSWVAKLTGFYGRGFQREYLKAMKDYSHANSVGSRGVTLTYWLQTGDLYEIHQLTAWSNYDHYFCVLGDDGTPLRLNESEARQWLNDHSALPF